MYLVRITHQSSWINFAIYDQSEPNNLTPFWTLSAWLFGAKGILDLFSSLFFSFCGGGGGGGCGGGGLSSEPAVLRTWEWVWN